MYDVQIKNFLHIVKINITDDSIKKEDNPIEKTTQKENEKSTNHEEKDGNNTNGSKSLFDCL